MEKTGNGGADRDDFEDAADFVAWYVHQTFMKFGVRESDAYNQYLAYHEGHGGFQRGTWREKASLQRMARRVAATAWRYQEQLSRCQGELELAAYR
ncbi:MAG: lipoprotein [Proteobacteria bacterium]|nr:lipoprotein [Pseudomonadota bacterium]